MQQNMICSCKKNRRFSSTKRYSETGDRIHVQINYKTSSSFGKGEESKDRDQSDNEFMINFKNPFQRYEQRKQFFDQDEYDVEIKSF